MNKALFQKYIKGTNFFPDYAPGVTNPTHKMRGIDGHGQTIDFSADDWKKIRDGINTLRRDLLATGGPNS